MRNFIRPRQIFERVLRSRIFVERWRGSHGDLMLSPSASESTPQSPVSLRKHLEQVADLLVQFCFAVYRAANFGAHQFPIALAQAERRQAHGVFTHSLTQANLRATATSFTTAATEGIVECALPCAFAFQLKLILRALKNRLCPIAFKDSFGRFSIRRLPRVKSLGGFCVQ